MKKIIGILMCMLMCVTAGIATTIKTTDTNPTSFIHTHKSMVNFQPWTLLGVFDIGATGQTGANGNAGAEFDGTYLYSTRYASNLIHRYDKNGTLVEEFSIPGVSGLRDLAFDGTYMYGSAANNTIYKMDFTTKTLIGTIIGSFQCRAIAYDSNLDVFYCKNWGDPCWIVDRLGNIVGQFNLGTTLETYGLAYDAYTPGGPYLWVFDQGDGTDSIIYQWDLTAGTYTGFSYDVNQDVGSGVGIAGGLWMSPDYESGIPLIGGCVQDSSASGTDWLFVYGMYHTNLPPNIPSAPTGPDEGVIVTDYTFSAVTTDPEGQPVYYMFDWGDGTTSDWIGPVDSGKPANAIHQWVTAGIYTIKVKAKDIFFDESDWSPAHPITIVGPSLEISNITGGLFEIQAVIKNTGSGNAEQVIWSIRLIGGVFIGKNTSGTLTSIQSGKQSTVSSKLILGFGKTMISVSASCRDASAIKDLNGMILLFLIIIK